MFLYIKPLISDRLVILSYKLINKSVPLVRLQR